MFAVTGASMAKLRHMQNGGKRARHSLDQWDRVSCFLVCEDIKLTPSLSKVRSRKIYYIRLSGANIVAVMDRDRRLTGWLRGQTGEAAAPAGFELNNPWRVRQYTLSPLSTLLTPYIAGEAIHVRWPLRVTSATDITGHCI